MDMSPIQLDNKSNKFGINQMEGTPEMSHREASNFYCVKRTVISSSLFPHTEMGETANVV